jgi:hypothetical protein
VEEPDPREPSTPATPAFSASSSPRRISASPTSAASFLVTAPHTPSPTPAPRPVATQVRTRFLLPCGRHGLRAEAECSAPPRRRAAAGDAGHRARLGCNLLQVPLPSSTRAPPAWPLPSSRRTPPPFGHRRAVSVRPRRVRIVCVSARVHSCGPRHSQACTPARVCRSLECKAGPLALFRAYAAARRRA